MGCRFSFLTLRPRACAFLLIRRRPRSTFFLYSSLFRSISGRKNPANSLLRSTPVTAFNQEGDPVKVFPSGVAARDELGLYQTAVPASIRGHVRDVLGSDGIRYRFRKGVHTESIGPTPSKRCSARSEKYRASSGKRVDCKISAFLDSGLLHKEYAGMGEAAEDLRILVGTVVTRSSKGGRIITQLGLRLRLLRKSGISQIEPHVDSSQHRNRRVQMLSEEGYVIQEFVSLVEASREMNTDITGISRAASGKGRRSGGYKWRFVD